MVTTVGIGEEDEKKIGRIFDDNDVYNRFK
jgi:hypothetical protein